MISQRAGRSEWWLYILGSNLAGSQLGRLIDGVILSMAQPGAPSLAHVGLLAVGHIAVVSCVLWVQWHDTARRAHDRDQPTWPFGIYAAITLALLLVGLWGVATGQFLPLHGSLGVGISLAAFVGLALTFGLRPGDVGTNRWGPPPKSIWELGVSRNGNYRPPSD
jgi:uncharacterized membrane protein YhaH (DUF805 family)